MARLLRITTRGFAILLGVAGSGCVTDRDWREAGRFRRPPMPTAKAEAEAARGEPGDAELLATIVAHARGGDLGAAAQALRIRSNPLGRDRLARQAAADLAATDPDAAVKLALQLGPGGIQDGVLRIGIDAKVRREPGAALRWALTYAEPASVDRVRRYTAEALMALDPRGTLAQLERSPADPARDVMLGFAAAAWARRDPEAAGAWLRGLPNQAQRQQLTAAVGFEIAQTNPALAIPYAESLVPGRDRWLLYTAITQTWVAVDAKAAFAWTNQLPSGAPRDAAVAGLDAGLGIAVARRMVPGPDTGAGVSRRAGGAGGQFAGLEEDAAFAAWLAQNGDGRSRDDAILEYVRQRGGLEPHTVGQWIVNLPGGPTRDAAIEIFWRNLITISSTEATRWLQSLPRSDRTNEMTDRMLREWLRTDPAAAEAWLRESPLPFERVEGLLRADGRR